MSLGAVTLAALALAIVLSCTSRLNVGLLALALAWIIGVYVGDLPLRDVTAGFPIDLFLTLSGVTLLFAQAHVNGTLDIVAHNAIRLCRGRVGVVPVMYFGLGAALASAGPGNIATTGLLAPMPLTMAPYNELRKMSPCRSLMSAVPAPLGVKRGVFNSKSVKRE